MRKWRSVTWYRRPKPASKFILVICERTIEQDHGFIKKKVRLSQCFKSFHTTERALEGIEAVNMMRKGQVKRLAGCDAQGQAKFFLNLFQIAA